MKFIVNTALDPHFCVLFDEGQTLVERHTWTERKQDGKEIFDFLSKHNMAERTLSLVGGISGPGGFSSLRAGAGIINSIAVAKDLPTYQIRADKWVSALVGSDDFLLNSFSDGVFYRENNDLIRVTVEEAAQKFSNKEIFVGFLPPEKQAFFSRQLNISLENQEHILLELLSQQTPQKVFISDYEFPPV